MERPEDSADTRVFVQDPERSRAQYGPATGVRHLRLQLETPPAVSLALDPGDRCSGQQIRSDGPDVGSDSARPAAERVIERREVAVATHRAGVEHEATHEPPK